MSQRGKRSKFLTKKRGKGTSDKISDQAWSRRESDVHQGGREGILWEFHRSGLSVPEACRRLPLFPTRRNLYLWLRTEEAGELAATEMPSRPERMHCACV